MATSIGNIGIVPNEVMVCPSLLTLRICLPSSSATNTSPFWLTAIPAASPNPVANGLTFPSESNAKIELGGPPRLDTTLNNRQTGSGQTYGLTGVELVPYRQTAIDARK
jgi:hypothetical protein